MKTSQMARILAFDKEVRFGKYPNRFSFSVDYEISDRTVARDIAYLRDFLDAPLEYDQKRKGYYYVKEWTPPSIFSISAMNETEIVPYLLETINSLSDSNRNALFRLLSYPISC
jgi:predicted DNA-binding transcriptional regulator YafY